MILMWRIQMSRYTVELRRVIDAYGKDEVRGWFSEWKFSDYLRPDQIQQIETAGIWNTERLIDMILNEYYMREIGQETPDYFYRRVKVTMARLMEHYAPLIWTASIKYDPLVNVDYTETYSGEFERSDQSSGNSTSQSNSNGSGLTVNSDTPQGQISKQAILQGNYASQTQANETESDIHDTSNTSSRSGSDGTDGYTKTIKGNSGVSATAQRMIQQSREVIISIMSDITRDLGELFMTVY